MYCFKGDLTKGLHRVMSIIIPFVNGQIANMATTVKSKIRNADIS